MILPHPSDSLHAVKMYRLLIGIIDEKLLSGMIAFKGGTCAAMLGLLDRFSIDLDFDLLLETNMRTVRKYLHPLFTKLDFSIQKESRKTPFFILNYVAKPGLRNSLKLGMTPSFCANEYRPLYLPEIDRYCLCQTKETMFANKLVSLLNRYDNHKSIAGRDLYDIHHFFSQGFGYKKEIIRERRGTTVRKFFDTLKKFILEKVTQRIITEDLNYLLPYNRFVTVRNTLKSETLLLIDREIHRLDTKEPRPSH